ncbi:MAG TPA: N-6 DNA methylase [Candidatus Pacearchaeota archaeon]|nr:N-6 DNA methylase [Candidatus Pacearchaeota archaeon]HQM24607.1 N-6 DNA methylase [Candidatus Pacearchaeota archaeon]
MEKGIYVKKYLDQVVNKYSTGQAREHAYRPILEGLFKEITGLNVLNDPKRSEYGAPDFVFLKKKTTVAYAEAKDIGVSLNDTEKREQMIRYYGYSNLILTNSLEFRFYRNGQKYCEPIKIGELGNKEIRFLEKNYSLLEDTIRDFIKESKEPIRSGIILAKVMAGKARRIRDNISIFLSSGDEKSNENLLSIYNIIKKLLLEDLDYEKFADMYAQTVVYGLFVARYHDRTSENFSRQEARDLIPVSNPFLRHFFDHITGTSFDKRIEIVIDELCEEFTNADVNAIVHDYYKVEKNDSKDPIIHFYEDFLNEYDSNERKKMGVFYTPLPIVRFIVRSIDEILIKEFNLKGLADSSKIEMPIDIQGQKTKKSIHKVQVLDPATGTGTFLNEIILQIKKSFEGQEGRWSKYIKDDLLPRIHGFELMMAPYTIAHLKLSSTIKESKGELGEERLGVYLTNSLEKTNEGQKDLFSIGLAKAITEESRNANTVKNKLPIMVVLGNPPYNVSSQNKGEWIQNLLRDYKKNLGEKKINLDDDYIKFIRFAEYLIEKNGEGVIGMITNNSYLDGVTHRQMRKKLLESFDSIYILNLHGNSKKREVAPDGERDENVFNIQQGVAIAIFIRKSKTKKGLGSVYYSDLYGKRDYKFNELNKGSFKKTKWEKLNYKEPYFFFVPKNFALEEEYNKGFSVKDIFNEYNSGIQTKRDNTTIHFTEKEIVAVINDFQILTESEIRTKYHLPEDGRDWKICFAKNDLANDFKIGKILYRPFDIRYTVYSGRSKGFIAYPREKINKHIFNKNNLVLITCRNQSFDDVCLVSNYISDLRSYSNPGSLGTDYVFPLYIYDQNNKTLNFKQRIIAEIYKINKKLSSEDIFYYIYAVLHSPSYLQKYKEFLKIDFPRVPYPKNKEQFMILAKLGKELTSLHLLEHPDLSNFITSYPVSGNDKVEKVEYKDGMVYINKDQYFKGVPKNVWEFYIGGYQPAQKWLKDRKGRELSSEELVHYQKIIVSILKTIEIMNKIDNIKL